MNTPFMLYDKAESIIQEGWDVLVEQMGIERATQFVMLLERGKGDSVEEIIDFWGNATIDDIYERINAWKAEEADLED